MTIDLRTRPKDCQQKTDFKMETLKIQTIFATQSVTSTTTHYPKT